MFLHLCDVWPAGRLSQAAGHDPSTRDPHWFCPGWCSICSSWLPPLWDNKRTHAPITVCRVTHQSAVREGKLVRNTVHCASIDAARTAASFIKSSGLTLFLLHYYYFAKPGLYAAQRAKSKSWRYRPKKITKTGWQPQCFISLGVLPVNRVVSYLSQCDTALDHLLSSRHMNNTAGHKKKKCLCLFFTTPMNLVNHHKHWSVLFSPAIIQGRINLVWGALRSELISGCL